MKKSFWSAIRISLLASVAGAVVLLNGQVLAAPLTASTTMTVVNVTSFPGAGSPPQVIDYTVNSHLTNVQYHHEYLSWSWDPRPWPVVGGGCKQLTGRIWKIASTDGYKTWYAQGWDYINNSVTAKEITPRYRNYWLGMMLSSLCDKTATCCNARGRTNIDFQQPDP